MVEQGLTSEIFDLCITYYALDARETRAEAKALLKQITAAGVKAYLYHMAGYTMSAIPIVSEAVEPIRPLLPVEEALCEFKVYKELLELVGVTGNAAVLGSNQATVSNTGIDLLARVGRKHLYQPEQVEVLNVTELGKRIGIGAIAMNLKLEGLGLQVKVRNKWVLTEAGKDYGVLLDTSKKQIVGTPVLQLKWKVTVLDLI